MGWAFWRTEAGPSGSTGGESSAAPVAKPLSKFERTLLDEEKVQAAQFPTPEEVPGCMQLFDHFLMCYALFPQMRNIYRYGEFRDCTYKLDDFRYCMSLKSEDPEERRQLWIKRKSELWASRRLTDSSEDVWDVRETPLENFPPLHAEPDASTPST